MRNKQENLISDSLGVKSYLIRTPISQNRKFDLALSQVIRKSHSSTLAYSTIHKINLLCLHLYLHNGSVRYISSKVKGKLGITEKNNTFIIFHPLISITNGQLYFIFLLMYLYSKTTLSIWNTFGGSLFTSKLIKIFFKFHSTN